MAIVPPHLKPGDKIAITCPSGYLPTNHGIAAKKTLEKWGFEVIVGETVGHEYHYFSGDDEMRRKELQYFLDRSDISAIMAGRGGYGLSRIIDKINFETFIKYPKWLIGFSDITVLHTQIHMFCHTATIHGPMCHGFMNTPPDAANLETLRAMLTGKPIHYVLEGAEHNRPGSGKGELVGGNLAILAHLCGSPSQLNTAGKILFIEEVGEHIYQIDRMLLTLKRAGMFDNLAGLVCGGFTEIKDTPRPFGATIPEIIMEKVAGFRYPVCFGFSAGHLEDNYPIMLGREHFLEVGKDLIKLKSIEMA